MISQADIIRTLVNKNCMDESIMSMVLSPDCTPPKLLEKFNEAERFDLALDVSMKLGLDASPIWKTWAMRCLKNRNFRSAREKFRHCFQRLRSSAGRGSPACSNLLCDILNELASLDEHRLPLSEELDLIKCRRKQRQVQSDKPDPSSPKEPVTLRSKPGIFAECLYYLKEYGTIEDHLKFYIRNKLWQQAVKLLLENRDRINADRFFIVEVVLRTSSTGRLDDVLATFIEQDPDIKRAFKYYKAMYNYYTIHKRYNSLYYLQNKIGDYVAAAENQIDNFFLKRPIASYKELNNRITSLIEAGQNYRNYIGGLMSLEAETHSDKVPETCSILFASASREEAEFRLKTIDTQIEITRNFAINEVQGCIHNIEVVFSGQQPGGRVTSKDGDNMAPVTLFDTDERRTTFLAALILIYFDLDCTAYFSTSGLELANKLIQDFKLDKTNVFKTAMRVVIEDESCDIIDSASLLLQRLTEDHLATSKQTKATSPSKARRKSSRQVVIREVAHIAENDLSSMSDNQSLSSVSTSSSSQLASNRSSNSSQSDKSQAPPPTSRPIKLGTRESARILCDDVISDSIRSCQEPDYKMKLTGLLSPVAKIELYIELGKLSNAQRLAFDMNRRDYVAIVMKEAERLNQDHIKDVCQHWLAKH